MGRKTIDHWSLKYWMLKYLWTKNVYTLFYKKIELRNAHIVPRNKPVIVAPNHQNALMDAMALVTQLPFQTVFMARADIFKSNIVAKILTTIKILPIYRIRDGISSLSKNEEIFEETTHILRNHFNPLCLFPEGNHGDKRRLRPLVKGIFRIAFKAQEDYKGNPGIKIYPVGIDYKHYQKFRQTLFVNFGQPIEVSEYWHQYEENQAIGTNALRDRLAKEMSKCMIDIQTEEYYDTYMGLREFYRPEMYNRLNIKKDSLANRFDADKCLINALDKILAVEPEKISDIDKNFKRYTLLREKLNFRDWVFRKPKYSVLFSIFRLLFCLILSPLFILGLFNNWPHFYIPTLISQKIKDTQFKSTAAWASGMLIQAIYYVLLIALAIFFIPYWWITFLYSISLPFSGLLAYNIRNYFIKSVARLRYTLNRKKSTELKDAIALRNEIINSLNSISL